MDCLTNRYQVAVWHLLTDNTECVIHGPREHQRSGVGFEPYHELTDRRAGIDHLYQQVDSVLVDESVPGGHVHEACPCIARRFAEQQRTSYPVVGSAVHDHMRECCPSSGGSWDKQRSLRFIGASSIDWPHVINRVPLLPAANTIHHTDVHQGGRLTSPDEP